MIGTCGGGAGLITYHSFHAWLGRRQVSEGRVGLVPVLLPVLSVLLMLLLSSP